MTLYARLCAWTLTCAHARSGDSIAIASYLGSSDVFDCVIAAFVEAYADQKESDHAALLHAIATGRIRAEPDSERAVLPQSGLSEQDVPKLRIPRRP